MKKEPDQSDENTKVDQPLREDLTRDQVIRLAMDTFGWTERKCTDWFKLEIKGLNGNSPMELVQRKQTGKIVALLNHEAQIRRRASTD